MLIAGLQKTTLIDFPNRVGATVFLAGCNFRCPFCHNKDLITLDLFKKSKIKPIKEKDFFDFLKKRKKILDGVCITGGEPTINKNLPQFCKKIKDLGLEVKLDSNGSNPKMLEQLIKDKLVDFVAMDIKTDLNNYKKANNIKTKISDIKKSIQIILKSGLEYEFRTTVVPKIHNQQTLIKLAKQLKKLNPKIIWIIQKFQPENCLDPKFLKIKPYSSQQMKDILISVQEILPQTKLRGTD